jgi:hypothetical protein
LNVGDGGNAAEAIISPPSLARGAAASPGHDSSGQVSRLAGAVVFMTRER